MAKYGDEAGDIGSNALSTCRNSFVAGAPVLLSDGSMVPIEDVDIGDVVATEDPEAGTEGENVVTDLIVGTGDRDLVTIGLDDGSDLTATTGHPIWHAAEDAWVDAGGLFIGDLVVTADGDLREVVSLFCESQYTTVYNLTVDVDHTYYAGDSSILNHNASCGEGEYLGGLYDCDSCHREGIG